VRLKGQHRREEEDDGVKLIKSLYVKKKKHVDMIDSTVPNPGESNTP
jgi:hypothetical protein